MIGEQMEHMTNANKDKQIKRKIEPSPVLEHRLQQFFSSNSPSMSLPIAAKLGDHNYNAWKYEMQAVLMQKGLWLIVSSVESTPKDTKNAAFKEWCLGDMQAADLIYNLVEPSVYSLIRDFITSGMRMWAALASHYE